jgi:hypothetical protein
MKPDSDLVLGVGRGLAIRADDMLEPRGDPASDCRPLARNRQALLFALQRGTELLRDVLPRSPIDDSALAAVQADGGAPLAVAALADGALAIAATPGAVLRGISSDPRRPSALPAQH